MLVLIVSLLGSCALAFIIAFSTLFLQENDLIEQKREETCYNANNDSQEYNLKIRLFAEGEDDYLGLARDSSERDNATSDGE